MGRWAGVLGMAVILGLAWLFSTNRKAIKLKTIVWGLGLQLALGIFVLRSSAGRTIFDFLGKYAKKLLSFSYAGSSFVFGDLGLPKEVSRLGFSFAFQVLPTIIFIAAFFAVLYHLGVMQLIIRAAAWVMTRVILAIVFFLVVLPIGVLRRLTGNRKLTQHGGATVHEPVPVTLMAAE